MIAIFFIIGIFFSLPAAALDVGDYCIITQGEYKSKEGVIQKKLSKDDVFGYLIAPTTSEANKKIKEDFVILCLYMRHTYTSPTTARLNARNQLMDHERISALLNIAFGEDGIFYIIMLKKDQNSCVLLHETWIQNLAHDSPKSERK